MCEGRQLSRLTGATQNARLVGQQPNAGHTHARPAWHLARACCSHAVLRCDPPCCAAHPHHRVPPSRLRTSRGVSGNTCSSQQRAASPHDCSNAELPTHPAASAAAAAAAVQPAGCKQRRRRQLRRSLSSAALSARLFCPFFSAVLRRSNRASTWSVMLASWRRSPRR